MRLFSKASEHAIRALMKVVETSATGGFSTREVARNAGVPVPVCRKALGALAKAGILASTPGPGGGYRLARDLSDVTLFDVVRAVDGPHAFAECPLGHECDALLSAGRTACETCVVVAPACGLDLLCPLHGLWRDTRTLVIGHLERTTLADIETRWQTARTQSGR